MTASNTPSAGSFEHGLKELEVMVAKMESGDLGLEESMKTFEQGMKLVQRCRTQLDEVEKKIEVLTQEETESEDKA